MAVLTASGSVYTFGDNSDGQLGRECAAMEEHTPRQLRHDAMVDTRVVDVATGSGHTSLVLENGSILVFGANANGSAGIVREVPG